MITEQLEIFKKSLPKNPYCTNALEAGIYPRSKDIALKRKYLQPNQPLSQKYLVFDLDYPGALEHIRNNNLPAPNFAVFNNDNGRSHLFYELETQVLKFETARRKPIEFLAKVEDKLSNLLKSDLNYIGLISKNPFHQDWTTLYLKKESWELNDFLDYFELPKTLSVKSENRGLGRNVALFDKSRFYAYSIVDSFRSESTFELFKQAVFNKTEDLNQIFEVPLPYSEVKSTAKSIAKWTWKYYGKHSQEWINASHSPLKQAKRGKKSGEARYNKTFQKRLEAQYLDMFEFKQIEIADFLKVTQQTASNWIR